VLDQIEIWRKELVNLARSNRLLYFRHTKSSTLEIVREPDQIQDVVAEVLAGRSWRFYVPPEQRDAPQDEMPGHTAALVGGEVLDVPAPDELLTTKSDARSLRNALRLLERRATQEFMDKGIWILYLAAGVLRWRDPGDDDEAHSPLVLVPVELRREHPEDPYELRRVDEDVVINPALSLRLADFGIELPTIEQDDFDLAATLDGVEDLVFGQEGWQVERRLLISPFSFHKEVMYRDLLHNVELIADHQAVQALALGAEEGSELDFDPITEERLDEEQPPEQVMTILDADATQRQCIAAAASGRSFVMDGPPGTGKSQTIANVIAELLAQGKTVLFVSEKAAALEVVQKRLRLAGLGDYALELHSHKATRKEVAQQLGASLSHHPTSTASMSETAISQLRQRREQLSRRARAVNEVRQPLGRSLHQVIGRIAQLQSLPQAPPPSEIGPELSAAELARITATAAELARAWGPVTRGDEFLWRDLRDVHFDASRVQRTAEETDGALSKLNELRRAATDAADACLQPAPRTFPDAERLLQLVRHIEARRAAPRSWLTSDSLESITAQRDLRLRQAAEHTDQMRILEELLGPNWSQLSVSAAATLTEADTKLNALPTFATVRAQLRVSELGLAAEFARSTTALLDEIGHDATAIAHAFDLKAEGLTIRRAGELAQLGSLAASSARPELEWLNPALIDGVERAAQALEPLCLRLADLQKRLGSVFTDEVLNLDLENLHQRFETVHRGLGKLGSAYRNDKKSLAAATRAGTANKSVIALLPDAIEWQMLSRQLEAAERDHAAALGEHYYRRTDTDFAAISETIASAHRAIEICGRQLNIDALQRQLARGGSPDAQLVPAARRIAAALEPWNTQTSPALSAAASQLAELDPITARADCEAAVQAFDDMLSALTDLGRLPSHDLLLNEVHTAAATRLEVARIEDDLRRGAESDRRLLGERYDGLTTDWAELNADLGWAELLQELVGGPLSIAAADRVQTTSVASSELHEAIGTWCRARDGMLQQFEEARAATLRGDMNAEFEDAVDVLAALKRTTGDIDEWIEHQQTRRALAELGLSPTVDFCEQHRLAADALPLLVERACLESWVDRILESDGDRLRYLRANQLHPIVEEFRRLDVELINRTSSRVIDACNRRRPRTTIGAAGVIQREAQKQRRHMPVRKLLEETGEVAQALKPCFMMSPLTVSQFLPPSLRFDVVVFDEASQVRPSDAVNCIYRGSQLIVAGDDQQLPPTSFFEAVSMDGDDEYEEDQFEQYESILKQCKSGGLRELPLRWHYRSQHEDLIAYSNESFYRGQLVTFPGAVEESDTLGVKHYHVPDGVYRRGTARDNPREAEAVVERVMHWARASAANPDQELTIGVVAFSEAQAATIEAALDRRREGARELDDFFAEDRLDGFFVKNLENVQGDERDVMIFSIGYGRDENGRLTMNFGPLNREGGQRRLNVAITRARQRVEVVSSITGTEAEFNTELREGIRHLRRYLDYAARGPAALAIELDESGLDADSPFEEEVLRTIRSWGYDAVPQVGTAGFRVDIGIKHPSQAGRYALGVECDGWMYHSSKVARDRDRLRQEVLERLGWRIYRIWGTAWYRNRNEQEERLRAAIADAINGGVQAAMPIRRAGPIELETEQFEPVALDEAPSWTVPYRVARPMLQTRQLPEMHLPEAQWQLRQLIENVVAVEGPVLDTLVLRRAREAWGVGRAGRRIRDAFEAAVRALTRSGTLTVDRNGFLARDNAEIRSVRIPGDDPEARRGADEVPLAEMQLAVTNLIADAKRVRRDELTFGVARLFGWNRRGPEIAAALDRAVDGLLRNGTVTADDEYLVIS
jgi:hypothetical protein